MTQWPDMPMNMDKDVDHLTDCDEGSSSDKIALAKLAIGRDEGSKACRDIGHAILEDTIS